MFRSNTTGWVGFDVGAASVKSAQLVRRGDEYRLRTASIVPRRDYWTSANLVGGQPPASSDEIQAAASLCEPLSGSAAAAVLPTLVCDVVQLDAPPAKRGVTPDLVRAMELETQRSLANHVVGAWPVGPQPGRINAVAVPSAWSDRISDDVIRSGWNCQVVDVLPWALARAVMLAEAPTEKRSIAAVDWAYSKATMFLIHDGAPSYARSLKDCAYQDVVASVATALRLHSRDAEVLLCRHSDSTADDANGREIDDAVTALLDAPIARLGQEIRRTLGYWRGVSRGLEPEVIYLFGGGAVLRDAGRRLTEALGVEVKPWSLPPEVDDDERALPPACLLGAAAGLSALAWEVA